MLLQLSHLRKEISSCRDLLPLKKRACQIYSYSSFPLSNFVRNLDLLHYFEERSMNRLRKSDVQPHPFPSYCAHRDHPLHLHRLRIPKHSPTNTADRPLYRFFHHKNNSSSCSRFDCCLKFKKRNALLYRATKAISRMLIVTLCCLPDFVCCTSATSTSKSRDIIKKQRQATPHEEGRKKKAKRHPFRAMYHNSNVSPITAL